MISPIQFAFVPGRLISNNFMVGFECLYAINNSTSVKKGNIALKLDMSEAYDKVE